MTIKGAPTMSSMTAREATWRPGQLRSAVQDGEVVALTFHGRPYGYVVPADRWHALTNNDRHSDDHTEQEAS